MKKDSLSFNAQVGIGTDLFYKFRVLFAFLFVFFITTFSAQETPDKSTATITVTGDAFIYSKDKSFNDQISGNKDLHKNYNVEFTKDNELKISAKNKKKRAKAVTVYKKKQENIVLASKKSAKYETVDIPKKDIYNFIKNLDSSNQFFAGSGSGTISFIYPVNDFHLSKFFAKPDEWIVNSSVKFSDHINYFYSNDSSTLQVFHNDLSVRPPPSLI